MQLQSIIKGILETDEKARDDDGYLALEVLPKTGLSALAFIRSNIQKSIGRERQLIQKEHPELRGKTYTKRQRHAKDYSRHIRSRETPEVIDCSNIFPPIEPPSLTQKVFSFFKHIGF